MTGCSMESCARRAHARSFCTKHYARLMRHGDPSMVLPILGRPLLGDLPTAAAIHKRLSRTRGPAAALRCVDCLGPAREWSYDGEDAAELRGRMGSAEICYSLSLDHYVPRCVSCHRRFDGAGQRPRHADGTFAGREFSTQHNPKEKQ